MSSKFSRRQLFKLRPADLGSLVRQVRQRPKKDASEEEELNTAAFIRPPGALKGQDEFLSACERCNLCVEACPYDDVIQTFGASHGKREGAPYLLPDQAPCRWCIDTPCAAACPTEALQIPSPNDASDIVLTPIAKAVLNLDTCLNNQGTICDTCSVMCPPHVKAIKMIDRKPLLNVEQCTGCGMCSYYCESEPGSISIVALKE